MTEKQKSFAYDYFSRTERGRAMIKSNSVSDNELLFLIPNNVKKMHGLPLTRIAGKEKRKKNFLRHFGYEIFFFPSGIFGKRRLCAQNRHIERMHILVDGTVVLCCQDWRKEYVLGSVKTDDLHTIWESEAYEKMRRQIDQIGDSYPEICKKCKILLEGKKE